MFDCQRQAMSTSSPFRSPPRRCLEEDRQHSWTETSSGIMGFHHGVHDDLFMESHWRNKSYIYIYISFPHLPGGVVRFYHSCSGSSSFFSSSSSFSSTTSADPLPRPLLPCQLFALRQLPRAVGTAGPQLPASDLSGHGWTSTARF